MSELRNEVVEAMMALDNTLSLDEQSATGTPGVKHLVTAGEFSAHVPYWSEWSQYRFGEITKMLRRVTRHFGGVTWENPLAAAQGTVPYCQRAFAPMTVITLAEGVLMGRSPIPVIRKYVTMQQVKDLFNAEGFKTEMAITAMRFREDADLWAGLQNFVVNSLYLTGSSAGFSNPTAEVRLVMKPGDEGDQVVGAEKIFDLWGMSMTTVCASLYAVGVQLGRKWEEQETLEGILSATERGEA